jgi:hypothetical protein
MMFSHSLSVFLALGFAVPAPTAASETLIYVNVGLYRSADVTGHAEEQVKWNDDDLSDDMVCTESFAALELQHYLQQLTGRYNDFDTVKDTSPLSKGNLILVGSPASNLILRERSEELGLDLKKLGVSEKNLVGLGADGYCIRSLVVDGRRITILSGSSRVGTLYAAYDLLQRLGCRWVVPGEMHVEVPHIEGIPNLSVTEPLRVTARAVPKDSVPNGSGAVSTDHLVWMARNQFNACSSIHNPTGLMHKLGIESQGVFSQKIK